MIRLGYSGGGMPGDGQGMPLEVPLLGQVASCLRLLIRHIVVLMFPLILGLMTPSLMRNTGLAARWLQNAYDWQMVILANRQPKRNLIASPSTLKHTPPPPPPPPCASPRLQVCLQICA